MENAPADFIVQNHKQRKRRLLQRPQLKLKSLRFTKRRAADHQRRLPGARLAYVLQPRWGVAVLIQKVRVGKPLATNGS